MRARAIPSMIAGGRPSARETKPSHERAVPADLDEDHVEHEGDPRELEEITRAPVPSTVAMEKLRALVAELRAEHGSQRLAMEWLARKVGFSDRTILRMRQGTSDPKLSEMRAFARWGITLADFDTLAEK